MLCGKIRSISGSDYGGLGQRSIVFCGIVFQGAADEIGIRLSDTGESARFFTASGELTEAETQLLIARTLLEMGEKRLFLPDDATPAIEPLAHRHRAQTERIPGDPSQWAAQTARLVPMQLALHTDGIAASLQILAMLNRQHISLDDHRRTSPPAVRSRRVIDIPDENRAHALQKLNELLRPDTPGRFKFVRGDAHAWILPSADDGKCTVLAESADAETARELCDFYESILRQAAGSHP